MKPTDAFPESRVVEIWQERLLSRTDLVTEEGQPLTIIYPGRPNDDRGADFLDAVIATSQGLIRGDIEVHVRSSGWWAHRHHQDPSYNRVILHVVFWHDAGQATVLQNGKEIPTLTLHRYLDSQAKRPGGRAYSPGHGHMPCQQALFCRNTSAMGEILDVAGEERFLAKRDGFQEALEKTGASQLLYQAIMGALGYARNKHPLMELARCLPLRKLESASSGKTSDIEYITRHQALMLGTAGLLPSQRFKWVSLGPRHDDWAARLEQVWSASRQPQTMSEDDWHLFKVRPSNFPVRRIAAMSYLLRRFRGRGMIEELANRLVLETPVATGYHRMEKALQVISDGYWASHLDLGLPSRMSLPSLLGQGRAADIIVNVILPFTAARGQLTSRPDLSEKAFDLYRHYPRLAANAVERHMRNQLDIKQSAVNSARRQQGLIHIYKNLCSQGYCQRCPINE